jgi:hypothetical protein
VKISTGKAGMFLWVYIKIHTRGTYNAWYYESKERRGKISVLRPEHIHPLHSCSFPVKSDRTPRLFCICCIVWYVSLNKLCQCLSPPRGSQHLLFTQTDVTSMHICQSWFDLRATLPTPNPRPPSNSTLSLRQVQSSRHTAAWLRTKHNFKIYSQQLIYPRNVNLPLRPRMVTILLSRQPKVVFNLL